MFRRLFLDCLLPAHVERIVSVDSDMLIARPGLSRLADFDLAGRPLAAAYDMIFLMGFKATRWRGGLRLIASRLALRPRRLISTPA